MPTENIRFLSRFDPSKAERHAVILAGGDGTRLRSLTKAITGDERPKQFCEIIDGASLLDKTRERVALSVAPENTHFSLTAHHSAYFERMLPTVSESQRTVQPINRGTAPAILYSLIKLAKQAPDAAVAFFPSDHYFADDNAFMDHVESAFLTVDINPASIVVLGIEPQNAETSYGWIEPARSLFGGLARSVSRVGRFWEKPDRQDAEHLFNSGCLWNSFVMIGRVRSFLEMFQRYLPELYQMFADVSDSIGTDREDNVVGSIYERINETNFSRMVLEKCSDELLVMRVGKVGWSDLGEPERVIDTLNSIGVKPTWLSALAA